MVELNLAYYLPRQVAFPVKSISKVVSYDELEKLI